MRFFAPSDVYLEKNSVQNHKDQLLSLGTRAFIVTGRHSSAANGSLADVVSLLEDASVSYHIFNEVEENPSVETVAKAAEIGKAFRADFVIGIGGGSPLDAAKAIALLIANPEETSACLYEAKALEALPVAAIPTTCGTGSEVTPNAVLTQHDKQTKKSISYKIYPKLALVDGRYLAAASHSLLVNTSIDALAHCIESHLHSKANLYNHMFSSYGLQLWGEILPLLSQSQETPEESILEKMMLASTVAGMAIAQTGTSLPHALSYEITYHYGIPHGKACGIFLAAYMKEYARHQPDDVRQILSLLDFASLEAFRDFLQNLLGPVSITQADLDTYCAHMMENASKLSTYPFVLEEEHIREIMTDSLQLRA